MLLRKKVPLTIVCLVSVPLIILSIIVFIFTSQQISDIYQDRIRRTAELEGNGIKTLIEAQKREVELAAKLHEVQDLLRVVKENRNSEQVNTLRSETNELLEKRLKDSKMLQNIFVVDISGIVQACGNKDSLLMDINDRQYYHDALQNVTVVSSLLKSKLYEANVIVIATPVKDKDNNIIGILGNTINEDYFKNYLKDISIDESGFAYLLDPNGIIVAKKDENKLNESDKQFLINNLSSNSVTEHKGVSNEYTIKYAGRTRFVTVNEIPDLKLKLVVEQEKREMLEIAVALFSIIISATIICLVIAVITGIRFSKSITGPIDKLTKIINKAANGDLSVVCEIRAEDEIGQLSRDFNTMMHNLSMSHEELTAVYEELSATEGELRAQYDELQSNEEALRNSEEKFRLAIEGANDVIWEWNLETREFFASDKWFEVTGYETIKRLSLKDLKTYIHRDDIAKAFKEFKAHIDCNNDFYKSEFRIKLRDGNYRWVFNRGKALRNSENKAVKLAGSLTDISERKHIEEQIKFMAYYDTLTGLPNRALFIMSLEEELKKARLQKNSGGVLFLDLDNFKNINDTLGHDYGDRLLEATAERLKSVINGRNLISRFGGDEFILLIPDTEGEEYIIKVTDKLMNIFREPLYIYDKRIYITGSIGMAVYPKDGESVSVLLKNADTAMYKAKATGKNKYAFFDKEMQDGLERKTKIELLLRNALENNQFQIYYQPQYDMETKRISGFEALLRLQNEKGEFISPLEFIPIAEESGLIHEIGEWCLRNSCLKNKEWKDKGYEYNCISVNISSLQFQQDNFVEGIKRILEDTGLKPEFLEIEITETVLMKYLQVNVKKLEELRDMGVKVALDDFGTGYSSLNYLRRMPINTLKIDKSFIDGICLSPKEEAIAEGIIQMAHKMGLEVVAEGVEDNRQLQVLIEKKCDKVQGYLFSKPLPGEKVEELLV